MAFRGAKTRFCLPKRRFPQCSAPQISQKFRPSAEEIQKSEISLNPDGHVQFRLKSRWAARHPPTPGGGIPLMSMDWDLGI